MVVDGQSPLTPEYCFALLVGSNLDTKDQINSEYLQMNITRTCVHLGFRIIIHKC